MVSNQPYNLVELAGVAGVTPRTVRYYVAQGLLPAPAQSGRGPHYGADHLARLRMVRLLQERHLPLAEIRRRLDSMSPAEVAAAADLVQRGEPRARAGPTSAMDYIRAILETPAGESKHLPAALAAAAAQPAPPPAAPAPTAAPAVRASARAWPALEMPLLRRSRGGETTPPMSQPSPAPTSAAPAALAAPAIDRSQWDRVALTPDVELHVRRPLSRLDNKRVERLIAIAREILKEGSR